MSDIQNFPTACMYARLPSIISDCAGSQVLLFVSRYLPDMGNILIVCIRNFPKEHAKKTLAIRPGQTFWGGGDKSWPFKIMRRPMWTVGRSMAATEQYLS